MQDFVAAVDFGQSRWATSFLLSLAAFVGATRKVSIVRIVYDTFDETPLPFRAASFSQLWQDVETLPMLAPPVQPKDVPLQFVRSAKVSAAVALSDAV